MMDRIRSMDELTFDRRSGRDLSMVELQRRLKVPPGRLSKIRPYVDELTAAFIISNGLDRGATTIRTVANDVMDLLEKAGSATRAQTEQLSQDVTIRNVRRLLKKYRGGR